MFLSFPILSTLKIFVMVFSGIVEAKLLKLGILMENELLYCGNDKLAHYSYFPFSHLSTFCL